MRERKKEDGKRGRGMSPWYLRFGVRLEVVVTMTEVLVPEALIWLLARHSETFGSRVGS
jgi:hypothetical protein